MSPPTCERHVEHVLDVVIPGVAGVVFRVPARVQRREIGERLVQCGDLCFSIQIKVDAADFRGDGGRVGGSDAIGDVVRAAPLPHAVPPFAQKKSSLPKPCEVLEY